MANPGPPHWLPNTVYTPNECGWNGGVTEAGEPCRNSRDKKTPNIYGRCRQADATHAPGADRGGPAVGAVGGPPVGGYIVFGGLVAGGAVGGPPPDMSGAAPSVAARRAAAAVAPAGNAAAGNQAGQADLGAIIAATVQGARAGGAGSVNITFNFNL
ncbi:uncharacterized protein PAC_03329 [Phialocephala subalpina]|uniref:Uncharacterized protein n=1 Tax=Phialocephala subalpina TaxID=576137 RepID=A0A1L7WL02_9HELO|nr:uncharacterized protein PAC_03329 [Phialocephala subalpina]